MTTNQGKSPAEFLEGIFSITRGQDVNKEKLLRELICANGKPSLQDIAKNVISSDKTGWKECIGNLCKITGYSTEDLGIGEGHSQKIHAFGGKDSHEVRKKSWDEKIEKVATEFAGAKMAIA